MEKPTFPMRINRYLALKKYSTRRGADEIVKKGQVFINGKPAVLGSKVREEDIVEVKFRGMPPAFVYFAYNKPRGVATHPEESESSKPKNLRTSKKAPAGDAVFPVGGLDKESHGLLILTNDGRITGRLLSPSYSHEKEYVVTTKNNLRSSFKERMEAGVQIEDEKTEKCKVKIMDETTFRVILADEKHHQVRRMCAALFQEVQDIQCVRIMNVRLAGMKEGARRKIEGDELKGFLESLQLA